MPLVLPIEGAGEAPKVVRQYVALGSVEVGNFTSYASLGSSEVIANTHYSSLGSADVSKQTLRPVLSSIDLVNLTLDEALGSCEVMSGDSMLIMADIINAAISAENLAQAAYVDLNARLLIDGDEVAIKDFNFQKPTGRMGAILNVTLADPDYEKIQIGVSIDFSLVIKVDGVEHLVPKMKNSKLTEDDFSIKYRGGNNGGPIDSITFGALDAAGDRFTLTPTRPRVMFDPSRVRYDDVKTDPENAIRDEATGRIILPVIEPVSGLTMKKILHRAYTNIGAGYANVLSGVQRSAFAWDRMYVGHITDTNLNKGCGFNRVITNIKDYRVRQANFTIESGWHGGARPCVEMFDPVYFTTGANNENLVILDVDQPLEHGVEVYDVLLSYHKSLSQKRSYRPDTNQVLLTYQYMGNDPYENPLKLWREVEDVTYPVDTSTDPENPIEKGEEGYVKHILKERVREYYMVDDPDTVLDTLPVLSELTIEQTFVLRADDGTLVHSAVRTTSRDRTEHFYVGDLKVGHRRTLETRLFTPDSLNDRMASEMMTTQVERCTISWVDDPSRPGVKLQDRVVTEIQELCVVNVEPVEIWVGDTPYDHYPLVPLIEANLGGYINADEWTLVDGLVKSMTQTKLLRKRKGNQYDVLVTDVDHLNGGGARNSIAEPVTGTTRHDQYEVRSRTLLLKDNESIAEIGPRIPEQVNALELPRDRAIELGYRRLYRMVNPLKNMPIDLPTPVFSLDQGSVIRGQTRDGYTGRFLVTGYGITGQALGNPTGHRIFQNLETLELMPQ